MTVRYDDVLGPLRAAYDGGATWRDGLDKEQWKLAERQAFRERLAPARLRLISHGASRSARATGAAIKRSAPGTCADASSMRAFLHARGPVALRRGVRAVPRCASTHDLPAVLARSSILRPGGLFFVGVYGGNESAEGPIDDDEHVPPRFFSFRTDEQLLGFAASAHFDVVDFHPVDTGRGYRFQSLTLRRPDQS